MFGLEGVVSRLHGLPGRGIGLRLGVVLRGWFKFPWRWLETDYALACMSFSYHFFGLSLFLTSKNSHTQLLFHKASKLKEKIVLKRTLN